MSPAAQRQIRRGLPLTIYLALLISAPIFLSGAIRAVSSWSLGLALIPAIVVSLGLAVLLRRAALDEQSLLANVFVLTVAAVVLVVLYNRYFYGLMVLRTSGTPDAGNHVRNQHQFATSSPAAYVGFVALYAGVEWVKRIGRCNDIIAFAVVTYFAMALYAASGMAAASAALHRFRNDRRAYRIGMATAFVSSLMVFSLSLPLVHYHHTQGFFAPIFALIPLVALWLVDALVQRWPVRMAAMVFALAIYRYTYGLNVPDLLLVVAVVCIIDSRRLHGYRRWIAWLIVPIAIAGAFRVAARLQGVFYDYGAFEPYDLKPLLIGQYLLIAALLVVVCAPPLRRLVAGSGIARWLRVPLLLALVNAIFMTVVHPARRKDYYYLKSNLHALLLLSSACVVVIAVLVAAMVEKRTTGTRAGRGVALLSLVSIVAALAVASSGLTPYWPSLRERAFGRPPFALLKPVADAQAAERIESVLKQQRADFGGYLTSYFPTFTFMNAMFGFSNGGLAFYWGRAPNETPGHCVFWEGGTANERLEEDFPQRWRCDSLSHAEKHVCVTYPPSWNPQARRTLCWLCR